MMNNLFQWGRRDGCETGTAFEIFVKNLETLTLLAVVMWKKYL